MSEASSVSPIRAARELAHAATSLASEAARLARLLENGRNVEASISASRASIRSAEAAFELDEQTRRANVPFEDMVGAAVSALDAAEDALAAARESIRLAASPAEPVGETSFGVD